MKKGIHPKYAKSVITCACGNVIETRSIKPEMRIEICSNCHPVFTGKQKYVDTEGRLDRFQAMMANAGKAKEKVKKDKKTRVRKKKVSVDIKNIIADQEKRKMERQDQKKKKELKKNEEEAKNVKVIKKAKVAKKEL